jgi:uncharacterized glyoxalase superfamily protein PhnB
MENLKMNKIVPSLWFDTQCEEAMNHYVDTFNGAPYKKEESRIVSITRYEKGMEAPGAEQMEGKVLTGIFELAGQLFMALDGGPVLQFNFLETRRPCPVGCSLEVALALPEVELSLPGRVVLTNVPGNLQRSKLPCGMGVEFRRLAPQAREAVHAYVEERARAYEL